MRRSAAAPKSMSLMRRSTVETMQLCGFTSRCTIPAAAGEGDSREVLSGGGHPQDMTLLTGLPTPFFVPPVSGRPAGHLWSGRPPGPPVTAASRS
ncbi:hypothetical protein F751_0590 [Auxenochlorella protothecoides]|uniref:Uncharacterized protein n=1 Tax=Auxenochlorella protothecoides TaxID=3075 RepID=A0A087SIK9_AUXPR|nr:hypothetical protein F751_0590 [Auxenochlorella protothecoides]KFM25563.1 hypothetical protein F751_0590 [Auxenochlorella protothecoides]